MYWDSSDEEDEFFGRRYFSDEDEDDDEEDEIVTIHPTANNTQTNAADSLDHVNPFIRPRSLLLLESSSEEPSSKKRRINSSTTTESAEMPSSSASSSSSASFSSSFIPVIPEYVIKRYSGTSAYQEGISELHMITSGSFEDNLLTAEFNTEPKTIVRIRFNPDKMLVLEATSTCNCADVLWCSHICATLLKVARNSTVFVNVDSFKQELSAAEPNLLMSALTTYFQKDPARLTEFYSIFKQKKEEGARSTRQHSEQTQQFSLEEIALLLPVNRNYALNANYIDYSIFDKKLRRMFELYPGYNTTARERICVSCTCMCHVGHNLACQKCYQTFDVVSPEVLVREFIQISCKLIEGKDIHNGFGVLETVGNSLFAMLKEGNFESWRVRNQMARARICISELLQLITTLMLDENNDIPEAKRKTVQEFLQKWDDDLEDQNSEGRRPIKSDLSDALYAARVGWSSPHLDQILSGQGNAEDLEDFDESEFVSQLRMKVLLNQNNYDQLLNYANYFEYNGLVSVLMLWKKQYTEASSFSDERNPFEDKLFFLCGFIMSSFVRSEKAKAESMEEQSPSSTEASEEKVPLETFIMHLGSSVVYSSYPNAPKFVMKAFNLMDRENYKIDKQVGAMAFEYGKKVLQLQPDLDATSRQILLVLLLLAKNIDKMPEARQLIISHSKGDFNEQYNTARKLLETKDYELSLELTKSIVIDSIKAKNVFYEALRWLNKLSFWNNTSSRPDYTIDFVIDESNDFVPGLALSSIMEIITFASTCPEVANIERISEMIDVFKRTEQHFRTLNRRAESFMVATACLQILASRANLEISNAEIESCLLDAIYLTVEKNQRQSSAAAEELDERAVLETLQVVQKVLVNRKQTQATLSYIQPAYDSKILVRIVQGAVNSHPILIKSIQFMADLELSTNLAMFSKDIKASIQTYFKRPLEEQKVKLPLEKAALCCIERSPVEYSYIDQILSQLKSLLMEPGHMKLWWKIKLVEHCINWLNDLKTRLSGADKSNLGSSSSTSPPIGQDKQTVIDEIGFVTSKVLLDWLVALPQYNMSAITSHEQIKLNPTRSCECKECEAFMDFVEDADSNKIVLTNHAHVKHFHLLSSDLRVYIEAVPTKDQKMEFIKGPKLQEFQRHERSSSYSTLSNKITTHALHFISKLQPVETLTTPKEPRAQLSLFSNIPTDLTETVKLLYSQVSNYHMIACVIENLIEGKLLDNAQQLIEVILSNAAQSQNRTGLSLIYDELYKIGLAKNDHAICVSSLVESFLSTPSLQTFTKLIKFSRSDQVSTEFVITKLNELMKWFYSISVEPFKDKPRLSTSRSMGSYSFTTQNLMKLEDLRPGIVLYLEMAVLMYHPIEAFVFIQNLPTGPFNTPSVLNPIDKVMLIKYLFDIYARYQIPVTQFTKENLATIAGTVATLVDTIAKKSNLSEMFVDDALQGLYTHFFAVHSTYVSAKIIVDFLVARLEGILVKSRVGDQNRIYSVLKALRPMYEFYHTEQEWKALLTLTHTKIAPSKAKWRATLSNTIRLDATINAPFTHKPNTAMPAASIPPKTSRK